MLIVEVLNTNETSPSRCRRYHYIRGNCAAEKHEALAKFYTAISGWEPGPTVPCNEYQLWKETTTAMGRKVDSYRGRSPLNSEWYIHPIAAE